MWKLGGFQPMNQAHQEDADHKLWKITIFNGNIHYFYGHFPVRKL